MKAEYLTRQLDILPMEKLDAKITIIGAGAIGSFTTLTLAKMGFKNITVWDYDEVDDVNINCQFYPITAIGLSKVESLKAMVEVFTGTIIKTKKAKYEGELLRGDIVISAVDSMAVRQNIFDNCTSDWLIDPRMAAEYMAMYVTDLSKPVQIQAYKKSLHDDASAVQERCTAKSTMYTVGTIAGFIGKAVKDIVTDHPPIESLDFNIENNSAIWFSDGKKLTM